MRTRIKIATVAAPMLIGLCACGGGGGSSDDGSGGVTLSSSNDVCSFEATVMATVIQQGNSGQEQLALAVGNNDSYRVATQVASDDNSIAQGQSSESVSDAATKDCSDAGDPLLSQGHVQALEGLVDPSVASELQSEVHKFGSN